MPQSEALQPRSITYLAYLLWSFPLSYILMLGTFYNLPLTKLVSLFFSFLYIAHSLLAVFTGWALYRLRPYAWHIFVFHSILMLAEQVWISYTIAENHIVEIPLAFVSLAIIGALFLLKMELRVPYFSPKIAWWESDPRYKISVPTQMTSGDHLYKGEIMDISSSGCFIKIKDNIRVDQQLQICFSLFDSKFECAGKVVWRTESGVTHPKGIGVRFTGLSKNLQTELQRTVKKLKSLSKKFKDLRAEEKASSIEKKVQALFSESQRKS